MWILSHLKLLQSPLTLPSLGGEYCINASQSSCKGDDKFERIWIREGEGDELYSVRGSGDLEKIWVPPTEINFSLCPTTKIQETCGS